MNFKLKRTISAALACMLLLGLLPASALAAGKADHWAAEYIQTAIDQNWIEANEAAPDKVLSRAEAAAILGKILDDSAALAGENADSALTRQDAVVMLADAFGLKASDKDAAADFADWADVADAARDAMAAAVEKGIVNGVGDNRLAPEQGVTLGELLKIVALTLKKAGDTDIVSVTAIGKVDVDGAKLSAIAVEYGVDLAGADVTADTFDVDVYQATWNASCVNFGDGEVGDITKVYVNDKPEISAEGGTGAGNYVIIEVYTDYMLGSEQKFEQAMAAGVIQKADIKCDAATIPSSLREVGNYTETVQASGFGGMGGGMGGSGGGGAGGGGMGGSGGAGGGGMGGGGNAGGSSGKQVQKNAIYGTYTITDIEGFQFYTNLDTYGEPDGPAFHVEHCFDEKDGNYYDFDVSYALYVPEDYDPSGSYAMVVVDNPAANEGTHPLVSVLETRSPALLASDWGQEQVKANHGLDGLIVVVPVVEARVDDNACTPGQYEALLALWDHIRAEYSIDENHVYAIGQSVGGMVLMETNRNRDNYFAGILMFENQWAQNYYKDGLFIRNMASDEATAATAPMHYPRTDADITWDFYYDEAGNKVTEDHDPYNLYYLVSDDNIMVMNRSNNNLSNNTWRELSFLYSDLVGYELKQCLVDGNASIEEQEATIQAYFDAGNTYGDQEMGLYWVTFQNGSNGYSARKVLSGYEWLLSQSREVEMSRTKLDVNKPFELADEQIQDESRATAFTDPDGNTVYCLTAKEGAGTQFYNTSWLNLTKIADAAPGWLPEGMSWETGVKAAEIGSVTAINADGKLTAVAIQYSVDMKDIVVNLKGDDIIGLDGKVREDIKIILDPYEFYDADGNKIDCAIKNVYVNDSASVVAGAERGSGEGSYVIVELDTDSSADSVGVIQRTTIRTNEAIATATATLYE